MQRDLAKDRSVLCQETTTFTTARLSSLATPHSTLHSFTAHHSKLIQTLGFLSNKPSTICINAITKYRNISTTLNHDGCMAAFTCSKSKRTHEISLAILGDVACFQQKYGKKDECLEQKYKDGQISFSCKRIKKQKKKEV